MMPIIEHIISILFIPRLRFQNSFHQRSYSYVAISYFCLLRTFVISNKEFWKFTGFLYAPYQYQYTPPIPLRHRYSYSRRFYSKRFLYPGTIDIRTSIIKWKYQILPRPSCHHKTVLPLHREFDKYITQITSPWAIWHIFKLKGKIAL